MSTKSKEILPNLLGVKKAIEFSEGVFTSSLNSDLITNLGLKGFEVTTKDEKGIGNPIRPSEKIYLNEDKDILNLEYGLVVTGTSQNVNIINSTELHAKLESIIVSLRNRTVNNFSISRLIAAGYAYNIYIGAPGFRNRDNSKSIITTVYYEQLNNSNIETGILEFKNNTRMFGKSPFSKNSENMTDISNPVIKLMTEESEDKDNFIKLVNFLELSFLSDNSSQNYLSLNVKTSFKLVKGSIVYPSEIFPGDKDKDQGKRYYKTLASKKTKFGLTPEKVNNALRTIDSFFSKECSIKVTPIEPTGANLKVNAILRNSKNDIFYFLNELFNDNEISDKDSFFVYACFIRGGLFNKSSKK